MELNAATLCFARCKWKEPTKHLLVRFNPVGPSEAADSRTSGSHGRASASSASVEVAKEGVALLRDLVHERPIVVFSVVSATALLLARFASARTLGTAAAIGAHVAN